MATGKEIKRLRGRISAQDAATLIGVDVERLRKWEQRDADPKDTADIKAVEDYFGCKLSELPKLENFQFIPKIEPKSIEEIKLSQIDLNQPVIQVILNLSYTGRKNADTMDKLATTHQQSTDIIAALVAAIVPNSKLAEKLTASLVSRHEADDEDFPIEDELNTKGIDLLRQQLQNGKRKKADKNHS
jgi:transcriptional regulator with XRE-family HTH domain